MDVVSFPFSITSTAHHARKDRKCVGLRNYFIHTVFSQATLKRHYTNNPESLRYGAKPGGFHIQLLLREARLELLAFGIRSTTLLKCSVVWFAVYLTSARVLSLLHCRLARIGRR